MASDSIAYLDMLIELRKSWPDGLDFSFSELLQRSAMFYGRDQARLYTLFTIRSVTKKFDERLFIEAVENLSKIRIDRLMQLESALQSGRAIDESHIRMLIEGKLTKKTVDQIFSDQKVKDQIAKPSRIRLNDEQLLAANEFEKMDRGILKVNAYAGTGKTLLLMEVCRRNKAKKCLYLTFSRSLKDDAIAKFNGLCVIKTIHSVAYDSIVRDCPEYKRRIGFKANEFDFVNWALSRGFNATKSMSIETLLKATFKAMKGFYSSPDEHPSLQHLPDEYLADCGATDDERNLVVRMAQRYWEDERSLSQKLKFPLSHDAYIKIFFLNREMIYGYARIFFDEFQDADRVMTGIILAQQEHTPVMLVGDEFQQIFAWRGAVDSLQSIKAKTSLYLTQSYRFGRNIARIANLCLKLCGASRSIQGLATVSDSVHDDIDFVDPHVILFRTNAGMLEYMATATRPVLILHKTTELLKMLEGAFAVHRGKTRSLPQTSMYRKFESLDSLAKFAELRQDYDLERICAFVKSSPAIVPIVIQKIRSAQDYSAPILLTTIHAAKGKEWERVRVFGDFRVDKSGHLRDDEEKRLLYVAVTRAKSQLSIPQHIRNIIENHKAPRTAVSRAAHSGRVSPAGPAEGGRYDNDPKLLLSESPEPPEQTRQI